ncbi:MAG: amidohydrolase family protein [Gammaproteobacteria bacterium]|nr:amidohydrolase family protein [Gammaproteobacteria bacterium]
MLEGRIVSVGPGDSLPTRGAARLEHCDGGVVTAGFQNSHVHFTEPKWDGAMAQPAGELADNLRAMLTRHGFTTVVDTASRVENTIALRARIQRGEIAGPRILTAGLPLYPEDGIPVYLRDMPAEFLALLPQPASVDAALAIVQSNLDRGADATKLFVMTPQGGGRVAFMDPEVALAAADATHRRGLPVLVHPTDIEGIDLAIEVGADVLVHTTIGGGRTEWDETLVAKLVEEDIAVVPTLKLWRYELERAGVPADIVALAQSDAVAQARALFPRPAGRCCFGTDVGYMEDYGPTEEYRQMARALTPMQILASLTTAPAARWLEDASRGRVEAGQQADLVVLDADPAEDATRFASVRCTIARDS